MITADYFNDIYKQYKDINMKDDGYFKYKITMYTDGCSKGNPGIGGYEVVLLYNDLYNHQKKKIVTRFFKYNEQ